MLHFLFFRKWGRITDLLPKNRVEERKSKNVNVNEDSECYQSSLINTARNEQLVNSKVTGHDGYVSLP